MNELLFASIKSIREKIEKKEVSAPEVLDFFIKRFKTYDQELGSALEVFEKDTIDISKISGALGGIPGLIKDNICQKNRKATCASKILQNYIAPYDATAISKLKESGALLIGRANCDEFAMGSSTETSAYQKTKNPWDTSRVPGGSSGGSVAAVAAGLVPWSLGSETGGSVRQPAALCSVVGMKPTYGLISRYGLIAYGSSLDQIGPVTKTVYDNALVLSVMAGKDARDSSSRESGNTNYTQNLNGKLPENCTIGIIENALYADGMDAEVVKLLEDVIKQYESLGAKIKRIKLPTMDYAAAVYFMISRAEAASNLARFDGVRYGYRSKDAESLQQMYELSRSQGFGQEVQRRILIGNYVLSAGHSDQYYESAKIVRSMMREESLKILSDVDLLFSPVSPTAAFKFGAFDDNRLQMDLQDYFTASANLAGIPALAIPCGFTKEKLPVGFQLIGADFSEDKIYQAAYAYEQSTNWHLQYPEKFK